MSYPIYTAGWRCCRFMRTVVCYFPSRLSRKCRRSDDWAHDQRGDWGGNQQLSDKIITLYLMILSLCNWYDVVKWFTCKYSVNAVLKFKKIQSPSLRQRALSCYLFITATEQLSLVQLLQQNQTFKLIPPTALGHMQFLLTLVHKIRRFYRQQYIPHFPARWLQPRCTPSIAVVPEDRCLWILELNPSWCICWSYVHYCHCYA